MSQTDLVQTALLLLLVLAGKLLQWVAELREVGHRPVGLWKVQLVNPLGV